MVAWGKEGGKIGRKTRHLVLGLPSGSVAGDTQVSEGAARKGCHRTVNAAAALGYKALPMGRSREHGFL